MATEIDGKGNEYLFTFSYPETDWIKELAKGMGITKEAVLGAAMNKGLLYYIETFAEAEVTPKIQDIAQGKINNPIRDIKKQQTYDKGDVEGEVNGHD